MLWLHISQSFGSTLSPHFSKFWLHPISTFPKVLAPPFSKVDKVEKIEIHLFIMIHNTSFANTMEPILQERYEIVTFGAFIIVVISVTVQILDCCFTKRRLPEADEEEEYFEDKEIDFVSIRKAVHYVLTQENIRTRQDLDEWCNGISRERLYKRVRKFCKISWLMEENPKSIVRQSYESLLPGYTNSSIHFSTFNKSGAK